MVELAQIKDPADLRLLSREECEELADDIRTKIIQTVSRNGGHLSSNLGVVEITLALHRVFDTPRDKIIFDVGHQAYAHKLVTGRYDAFDTLRTYGGLSGFPRRCESEYDCFEAGHASTAISAALGLARARDARGEKHHVVAVVGDGALTGGMCYEALNDCGNSKTRLILVLNDNEMSIAQNVGALSKHLSSLRASVGWNSTKKRVKSRLARLPVLGQPIYRVIHTTKRMIKSIFVDEGFFSALGFRYLGPIDGNNLAAVEGMLRQARQLDEPVVIHCVTKKGYGYNRAERRPEDFHGTPPFLVETGQVSAGGRQANGEVAMRALIDIARRDQRIVAVTAAMPLGTCTHLFEAAFPDRHFDVGIAEEHAVTMCAGMASGGLRPFFFVYSTFLQRGYDQVLHDACIQKLPVVFMLDRAGISNEDGQSHQGLYDFAYLRHIPHMTVLAPADAAELEAMIPAALKLGAPVPSAIPKCRMSPGGLRDSGIRYRKVADSSCWGRCRPSGNGNHDGGGVARRRDACGRGGACRSHQRLHDQAPGWQMPRGPVCARPPDPDPGRARGGGRLWKRRAGICRILRGMCARSCDGCGRFVCTAWRSQASAQGGRPGRRSHRPGGAGNGAQRGGGLLCPIR